MLRGALYDARDPDLSGARLRARTAVLVILIMFQRVPHDSARANRCQLSNVAAALNWLVQ